MCKQTFTTYHPQTSGVVERINPMIKTMFAMFVNGNTAEWDIYLSSVVFAYNKAVQESTRSSPYALVYNHEAAVPIDQLLRNGHQDQTPPVDSTPYAQMLHQHLRDTKATVNNNISKAQQ